MIITGEGGDLWRFVLDNLKRSGGGYKASHLVLSERHGVQFDDDEGMSERFERELAQMEARGLIEIVRDDPGHVYTSGPNQGKPARMLRYLKDE
uniref:Uncharacterized protein n=1 Tax=uncultured Armatimonadetes bacterium TaxID=157466 RepID=A0A6J4H475_9BACT|nr:hypothetical protein AVDCRST_MAG63-50 [uncultured Armatimonadetes bacterium]